MELPPIFVQPSMTVREAVARIDRNQKGIVLVVDDEQRLLGTLTDGDVRRALLAGRDLCSSVADLISSSPPKRLPVTATLDADNVTLLRTMREHSIRQIPVLDREGRVASLMTLDELLPNEPLHAKAVIMAGGSGQRLRPLTDGVPKPMLPIGDRPLMEVMMGRLRDAGIRRVFVTTHYLGGAIRDHFQDGVAFGLDVSYVDETAPMGTAGSLALIDGAEDDADPFLIINGDVLTNLRVRAMLEYHQDSGADLTIGVRQYGFDVPYGVVESDGSSVLRVVEKPRYEFFVNAGIYVLDPKMRRYVPPNESFHMTQLIDTLVREGRKVVSFPVTEYWIDIGEPVQYEQAQRDMQSGRIGK